MQIQIYNRRKDILRFHSRGLKLSDYIEKLAKKHKCSNRALRNDFTRRHEWIPKILLLDNSKDLVNELMLTLQEARTAAWRVFHEADNDNARVGALKLLGDSVFRQIEVLQSLGEIQQVPQRIEGTLSVNPDEALHKLLRGLFANEPDVLAEVFKHVKT
jgi:hypothetical protein